MYPQILSTLAAFLLYFVAILVSRKLLKLIGQRKDVPQSRIYYIGKYFQFIFLTISLVAIAFIWSVDFSGIMVLASSIFAVVGIALFAQWSIISNITASVIMFFVSPIRVGDQVKIVDGDNVTYMPLAVFPNHEKYLDIMAEAIQVEGEGDADARTKLNTYLNEVKNAVGAEGNIIEL